MIQRGYASHHAHSPQGSSNHIPQGHRPSAHQAAKPHPAIEALLTHGSEAANGDGRAHYYFLDTARDAPLGLGDFIAGWPWRLLSYDLYSITRNAS
jgi:hypothetical protein